MSWQVLLKDRGNKIPTPKNMDNEWLSLLSVEGGTKYIEDTVRDAVNSDNTRGTVAARRWAKNKASLTESAFSTKHPSSKNVNEMLERAKSLSETLNELVVGGDTSTHTDENIDSILEELEQNNFTPLIEFIGNFALRERKEGSTLGGKNRKKKEKLLRVPETKKLILEKVKDNIDLWFVDTSEFKYISSNVGDKSMTEKALGNYNVKVVEIDEGLEIQFPEKVTPKEFKDIKDEIFTLKQKGADLKMSGDEKPSILYRLYGDKITSAKVRGRMESIQDKEYISSIENKQDVLAYLTLLTQRGKGWHNPEFMPETRGASKKSDAMKTILDSTSRPIVRPCLQALLTSESFNIEDLMESGATQREKRYIPVHVRYYLEPKEDGTFKKVPGTGKTITETDLNDLRELFDTSQQKWPTFLSAVEGSELEDAYDALKENIPQSTLSLFPVKEAKALYELRVVMDNKIKAVDQQGLKDIYGEKTVNRLAAHLKRVFQYTPTFDAMFSSIASKDFYKINSGLTKKIDTKILRRFIMFAGEARKQDIKDVEGTTVVLTPHQLISNIHREEEENANPWTEEYNKDFVTAQDILQLMAHIDYSYGDMSLNRLKNDYLDEEDQK